MPNKKTKPTKSKPINIGVSPEAYDAIMDMRSAKCRTRRDVVDKLCRVNRYAKKK